MTSSPSISPKDRRRKRRAAYVLLPLLGAGVASAALASVWSTQDGAADAQFNTCVSVGLGSDAALPTSGGYHLLATTAPVADTESGAGVAGVTINLSTPEKATTYATDFINVTNSCDIPLKVSLLKTATSGGFANEGIEMFVAQKAAPGNDFTVVADWKQSLVVPVGGTAVDSANTGTVAPGATLRIGVKAVADAASATASSVSFLVRATA